MRLYRRPNSPYVWYDFSHRGRRFRGSSGKKTEREARAIVAELIATAQQERKRGDAWRVRDLLGTYFQDVGQFKKSEAMIFHYFERLEDILGRDTLVADLDTARLLEYRAKRRADDGCSAVTVNRDLAMLKAAINYAADTHEQPRPPIAWKRLMVRENPHRIRFATADEFATLLTKAHPSLRPILIMAVTTGMRRSNILRLEWHRVDLDGGSITLTETKSGKPAMVRIVGPLRAALATLQPDKRLRTGRVFDVTNFRKRWDTVRKAAEVPDLRFHDLRHTFASWARRAGADLADIKEAMHHSSITVTMRYAHVAPDQEITAFDRVGTLLTQKGNELAQDGVSKAG